MMGRSKLSLAPYQTPAQRAESELKRLVSAFSESPEMQLLKLMFVRLAEIQEKVDELSHLPKHDTEEFVDARYIAKRFGLNATAATELMHRIGVLRVGPKGGSLRVRISDVHRFADAPERYEPRVSGSSV
jgi:hypothetical protein